MATRESGSTRSAPLTGAALVGAVAVLYLGVVLTEPEPNDLWVVGGFTAALLLAAALAVAGAFERDAFARRTLLGAATAITLGCAWLSGLSVGVLLLAPALLLGLAALRG